MLGLQQGFDGLRKSDDVRVAAYQLDFAFGKADNLDNVDPVSYTHLDVYKRQCKALSDIRL